MSLLESQNGTRPVPVLNGSLPIAPQDDGYFGLPGPGSWPSELRRSRRSRRRMRPRSIVRRAFPLRPSAAQRSAPARHHGADRTRRRRRQHHRRGRCLLRARPRLRLDRPDLRDAPDHGRLPGQARPDSAWHRAPPSPLRRISCCSRRRPPTARAAAICARAVARSSSKARHHAGQERDRHVLRRAGRRHRHDRAPRARCAARPIRFWSLSEGGLPLDHIVGLGHARHARHLQRRLQARRPPARSSRSFPSLTRQIHTQTVMPVAHLTWSAVWAGIAAGAVDRARAFVRRRGAQGQRPDAARRRASHARQCVAARRCAARHRGGAARVTNRPVATTRPSSRSSSRPA